MDFNHLNYLKQVVRDLYKQYSEYPAGENIRYEVNLGIISERENISPDDVDYRTFAVKQLKNEGVILEYITNEEQDDAHTYLVAKCLVDREKLAEHVRTLELPRIFYNKETGEGEADGKGFQFTIGLEEEKVFTVLCERINTALPRLDALRLIGYYDPNEKPQNTKTEKTNGTYRINEVAKKMREKTGISTKHLINSGGTLTLKGLRLTVPQTPEVT